MNGFQIRSLQVTGAGLPPASITFGPGLNVVSGASDTGKSFLFHAIDYMFGAAALDLIPEARPYQYAEIEIESEGARFSLRRSLKGGIFELREPDGKLRVLGERLNAAGSDNISAFLLRLTGLEGRRVRKNAENELQNLSFRNLAHLILVGEEEIIKTVSPVHGREATQKTAETNTFKLVLTGEDDSTLVQQKKRAVAKAEWEAQLAILAKISGDYQKELGKNPPPLAELNEQLANLDASISSVNRILRGKRQQLEIKLQERRSMVITQRADRERLDDVRSTLARFELLDNHYLSDLGRLDALREVGVLFPPLNSEICPLCGAPQESHSAARDHGLAIDAERIRNSCDAEKLKITTLRAELLTTLQNLNAEADALLASVTKRNSLWPALNQEIDEVLQISVNESERERDKLTGVRDEVRSKIATHSRISDLSQRSEHIQNLLNSIGPAKRVITELPSPAIRAFNEEFSALLAAWRFPVSGSVSFDTQSEDFRLGARKRREQGKGSRALTHAAFNIALMRYCINATLPHPGLVVLDSPLITFRERDNPSSYDELSLEERVQLKDEFYKDIAARVAEQQVIIFENEEPAESIRREIVFHHFTGEPDLPRCGFFPLSKG